MLNLMPCTSCLYYYYYYYYYYYWVGGVAQW